MKSYTDLEQSKKLAEILRLKSADMRYGYIAPYNYSDRMYDGGYDEVPYPKDFLKKNPNFSENEYEGELPCWSLAALLDVLSYPQLSKDKLGSGREGWMVSVYPDNCRYDSCWHDNTVDACVEMILKLHELNLL
jgi:hypothetical protein